MNTATIGNSPAELCKGCYELNRDCLCDVDNCPICDLDNGTACTCWLCASCMTTNLYGVTNCDTCNGTTHANPEEERTPQLTDGEKVDYLISIISTDGEDMTDSEVLEACREFLNNN